MLRYTNKIQSYLSLVTIYFSVSYASTVHQGLSSIDSLTPYNRTHHGSRLSYRSMVQCQPVEFGQVAHEVYPAHMPLLSNSTEQLVTIQYFSRFKQADGLEGSRNLRGHVSIVSDPIRTVSILEPSEIGGCSKRLRETVSATAQQKQCLVAVNAGYFHTDSGACLGNIISDGKKIQDSNGTQNAHFGIKKNGTLFFGYVSEEEVRDGPGDFIQLVGGVVWLVRNGSSFVNASKYLECEKTEETGGMDYFVDVRSARTAVGHDKEGRLLVVHVDGKTNIEGVSLWELAELMLSFGAVNAINLDGGGSSTFVINGTVVNYPSDDCPDAAYKCARKVSTVLCIHHPTCDCHGHGRCNNAMQGFCKCDDGWEGLSCSSPSCHLHKCMGNGRCDDDVGCICNPGWHGHNCSQRCPEGRYGLNCSEVCQCIKANSAAALCDPETGTCYCKPGFTGRYCHLSCPFGYYGVGCYQQCSCNGTCGCDSITGLCYEDEQSAASEEAHCYAKKIILKHSSTHPDYSKSWMAVCIILAFITIVSLAGNCTFLWHYCCSTANAERRRYSRFQERWWKIRNSFKGSGNSNQNGIDEEEDMLLNSMNNNKLILDDL